VNINVFWLGFIHYLRRASRDLVSLSFIILPVALAGVFSFIFSQNSTENIYVNGYNLVATYVTIMFMLSFQLTSGGMYLLKYLNHDLAKPMRWRLKATPCPIHGFIFSATVACTVFTMVQGLLIIGFTAFFMKVYWGNIMVTIFAFLLISIVAQLMGMIMFLMVRNLGTAESLLLFIIMTMMAFNGNMFRLPQNTFFEFMKKFGTPIALAQTAIFESGFLGGSMFTVGICLAALAGIITIFAGAIIALGRRKLS
jgi:hypothetical protein